MVYVIMGWTDACFIELHWYFLGYSIYKTTWHKDSIWKKEQTNKSLITIKASTQRCDALSGSLVSCPTMSKDTIGEARETNGTESDIPQQSNLKDSSEMVAMKIEPVVSGPCTCNKAEILTPSSITSLVGIFLILLVLLMITCKLKRNKKKFQGNNLHRDIAQELSKTVDIIGKKPETKEEDKESDVKRKKSDTSQKDCESLIKSEVEICRPDVAEGQRYHDSYYVHHPDKANAVRRSTIYHEPLKMCQVDIVRATQSLEEVRYLEGRTTSARSSFRTRTLGGSSRADSLIELHEIGKNSLDAEKAGCSKYTESYMYSIPVQIHAKWIQAQRYNEESDVESPQPLDDEPERTPKPISTNSIKSSCSNASLKERSKGSQSARICVTAEVYQEKTNPRDVLINMEDYENSTVDPETIFQPGDRNSDEAALWKKSVKVEMEELREIKENSSLIKAENYEKEEKT